MQNYHELIYFDIRFSSAFQRHQARALPRSISTLPIQRVASIIKGHYMHHGARTNPHTSRFSPKWKGWKGVYREMHRQNEGRLHKQTVSRSYLQA